MPVHDWTCVEAGIYHDFHHAWIEEIKRTLNGGILPGDYYALAERHAGGLGPDVLKLESTTSEEGPGVSAFDGPAGGAAVLLSPPAVQVTAETDMDFYRRKQASVVLRHVSGDRVVAVVEVVSPGNKACRAAIRSFEEKAAELLEHRIHLLVLDLHPHTRRDPQGIHGAIWEEISGQEYAAPADKPLTLAAYESALTIRACVRHVAVGDALVDMPLFLEPGAHVAVPLQITYDRAFSALPLRWRSVLEKVR
jgi:hypothetical protein